MVPAGVRCSQAASPIPLSLGCPWALLKTHSWSKLVVHRFEPIIQTGGPAMKKLVGTVAAAVLLGLGAPVLVEPALARPPTVTNSPGYQARLAESRKALSASEATTPLAVGVSCSKRTKHGKCRSGL
jgi:hypothetical protein